MASDRDKIENLLGSMPQGESALGKAVLCNDRAALDTALASGADPNGAEPYGMSPTLYAAALSRDELLRVLVKAGGDPNATDRDGGRLALSYAMSAGIHYDDWRAYYTLLEAGADINKNPQYAHSIAENASALGQFDKVNELLDRGYRSDLERLARSLEGRQTTPEGAVERDRALARVRELLSERERERVLDR